MTKHIARKRFGQNFLQDDAVIQHIIQVIAPMPTDHLIEIGPGMGALSKEFLSLVNELNVIELDRDLIPILEKDCASLGKLIIHEADVLRFDFSQFKQQALRLVGNLPYNITTPLLFYLLNFLPLIKDMHFMLQKEVVDRLAASAHSKIYGRLSVLLQYHCRIESLFDVPPEAFTPAPKVTSAIVRLIPYSQPPFVSNNLSLFKQIVASAFNYRRKTLHNSLKGILTDEQLIAANISPQARAEELSVEDFVRLSNV